MNARLTRGRAVVAGGLLAVAAAGVLWALLGPAPRGTPPRTTAIVEAPAPATRATDAPRADAPTAAPGELPRERVEAIAALGARLPDADALEELRALAAGGASRVERGAAISALWAGGDRAFLEELAAAPAADDAAFVRAKLEALRARDQR